MMTIVVPKTGFYVVGTPSDSGLQAEQVDKAKQCTCGGTGHQPCPHIRAVAAYLQLGGEPAPAPDQPEPEVKAEFPGVCPICGDAVIAQADHWRCIASPGHYWQHRGEQSGVKAFLTRPHPAKAGAFYEQSSEERDAFLESISHKRRGYSPYHPKGA
ncbi:MAG: hypothetical protein MUQ30_15455 [Anaerolineae bacterium]|nr:hypothetical protein [Anaerolineae bacterium]